MDDDDELAELRMQRAARGARATLSELREQQRKAADTQQSAAYFERGGGSRQAADDEDDEDDEPVVVDEYIAEEPDAVDGDPMRSHLPLSFGKQEVKVVKPVEVHEKTKRANPPVGPPRPPSKLQQQQQQQQPSVGPPRPPAATAAVGPQRPPSAADATIGPPRAPLEAAANGGSTAAAAAAAAAAAEDAPAGAAADGPPPRRPPAGLRGGWMTVEDVIGQLPGQQQVHSGQATAGAADDDGEALMGPPRPPPPSAAAADEGEAVVGPPRPIADDTAVGDAHYGMVGPPRPPVGSDDEADEGEDDEMQDDEEDDPYQLPVAHEVSLQGHGRAVSCIDIEHSGGRLISGSLDYTLRMFDFNGMKADLRSFREITPSDGHSVLAVSWSPSGEAFLCVTGSAQPRVYDRDGKLLGECVRGDMYIRDMKNTKGHITSCTGGCWHPTDRYTAITSSEDGTVRIWDTNHILQKTVVRPTTPTAARVGVTTCGYNSDGKLLAAGMLDGAIQVWGVGGKFGTSAAVGVVLPPSAQMVEKQGWSYVSKPNQIMRGAHEAQNDVTSLAFSQDDRMLASRSTDGSLKVWDLRAFKKPLAAFHNLPTNYSTTNVVFSPDERLLLTGTGAVGPAGSEEGAGGGVVFIDTRELREVRRVGMPQSVAAVRWHGRLNQIFAGIGDKRTGCTRVLYDTTFSERGALLAVSRAPRVANPFDVGLPLVIKTPHALPMYREEPGRKRSREKARQDPLKSRKPDPGATAGMGRAGRIGATGGTLLTQHLLKTRGKLVSTDAEMDPRESILRHADKKDDAISMLTAAYSKTQPKPVFAEPEPEEEEEG